MKKITSWLWAIVLPAMLFTLFSCQKDRELASSNNSDLGISAASQNLLKKGPVKRAYKDSFAMYLKFVPDIAGGWVRSDPDSHAWWPGYGDGNATHMGNASLYFTQYTVRQSGVVHMFSSPVTMFFATELMAYGVPSDVSAIVYDRKGNSVWFKNDPAGIPATHVSSPEVVFSGTMYIIGGTGKFAGATGEVILKGYFNIAPLATNPYALLEGSLWHDGWIVY